MIFRADVSELDNVLAFVEGSMDENGVSPKIVISYLVAVEEIFVNIASYAYVNSVGEGDVEVELLFTNNCVRATFIDSGIEFDPLAKADPDITMSAEERGIGGLGIYMVKKSMDGISYDRKDGKNILSFWKNY